MVQLDTGEVVKVGRHLWHRKEHQLALDPETNKPTIETKVVGSFSQFPLKLGYAMTIHKAQGASLDRVHLMNESGFFLSGQLYVVLSRCRSLDGLTMTQEIRACDVLVDPQVKAYYQQLNNATIPYA